MIGDVVSSKDHVSAKTDGSNCVPSCTENNGSIVILDVITGGEESMINCLQEAGLLRPALLKALTETKSGTPSGRSKPVAMVE